MSDEQFQAYVVCACCGEDEADIRENKSDANNDLTRLKSAHSDGDCRIQQSGITTIHPEKSDDVFEID